MRGVVVAAATALPALASVGKFRSRNCYDELVGVRSYSSGHTHHFVLEPSYYRTGGWNNCSTSTVRTSNTHDFNVPEWGVEVSGGSPSDSGAYGYCTGIQ